MISTPRRTRLRAAEPGFGALPIALRALCVLAFVTGAADLLVGPKVLAVAGASLPHAVTVDPVLNSQVSFWGAVWFGYGAALWWVTAHLRSQALMLHILLGTVVLGGVGRAVSAARYGGGGPAFTVAMVVELVGPVLLWRWHRARLRTP